MIDMLERVQRMCETSGSGSGTARKYDSSGSDADLDRRDHMSRKAEIYQYSTISYETTDKVDFAPKL
ncbi:unnamed protein product [Gongylonema pulchrum]|uniref:DNA-directed RNA polymerase n=1 Tax=Gongylonema pulchrum TaxID=637853 RepID=A0A183DQK4_9BILA|nr:unnamed protein product [Gongylonema pulchrum]